MVQSKDKIIETLLLQNYEKYYTLAYSYVHNQADALDVVQEGAYKAILKSKSLRNKEFAATWIYRIMVNEALQVCRKKANNSSEDELQVLADITASDPAQAIDLEKALQTLTYEERRLLKLRYYEDMKLEDMSELLGENLSTVKSKLYRLLKKLRNHMDGR